MKPGRMTLTVFLSACFCMVNAQEKQRVSSYTEQQLENTTETGNADIKDDGLLQQLDEYRKHPLNINEAGADELNALHLLSALQVEQLLSYRRLLGNLLSLYELQAVPGWDIATIRRVLPFVIVSDEMTLMESLRGQWKGGNHTFTLRSGRVLEKAKAYDAPAATDTPYYRGSRDKFFFRYKYNYKNTLQWGLLGDKDAGESFFDFYSFHVFARLPGIIKTIALGDFTVNMGQGLIQWQSLAFKKSADVLAIKRQSPVLRPYNSPGEYNFHRGAGITLRKNKWEATLVASFKKIDGTPLIDSVGGDDAFSSFRTSGYHRSVTEKAAKGIIRQTAFGANTGYRGSRWRAGVNMMHYHFSLPLDRADQPYHLFAFNGRSLTNAGMDYSYTVGNLHLFGEAAADDHRHTASVQGALLSPDARVDLSLLYRRIDKGYQSLYSNAFTESTAPVNENGLYAGIAFRPVYGVQVNAYADIFQSPWLKYRVDAPAGGSEYLVQLSWTPDKETELYIRYKQASKPINRGDTNPVTAMVVPVRKQDLRLQYSMAAGREWTLRQRVELSWYDKNGPAAEQGFMAYTDGVYQPPARRWRGAFRLQYFETTGYNTRIYAMEADVPYHISVPGFYDKGFRYYINAGWQVRGRAYGAGRRRLRTQLGLRWAQTIYRDKTFMGTGPDAIAGNRKSEATLQLTVEW